MGETTLAVIQESIGSLNDKVREGWLHVDKDKVARRTALAAGIGFIASGILTRDKMQIAGGILLAYSGLSTTIYTNLKQETESRYNKGMSHLDFIKDAGYALEERD